MIVKNIKIKNYRNFKEANIELNDSLNIFVGDNGQGKTNLMESVYLSSIGRTFRLNSENELINFCENKSLIEVLLNKNNYDTKIELVLEKNKRKTVLINGVKLDKTSEMIGILNNVIFTPDDMKIIKGSPVERRKFVNISLSQIKPKYKYLLSNYKKICAERNMILKNYCTKPDNKDIINIWNDYLINIGTEIILYRNDYINKLKKYAVTIYEDISGKKEKFDINYNCNAVNQNNIDKNETKKYFTEKINSNLNSEIQYKTTLYGPHKDDIIIKINSKESKYFGSQGQQRSAVLAIKLAEIEIIREETGEYPILLLDDVLSELDNKRKGYLIKYIQGIQTVITTTDDNDLNILTKDYNKKKFYINEGKIGNITN
ncbi:DNA replication/repair protein RecF [Sedimentibacter hydroxybenzoicus DSM 7310]|uniref:DNA replication and repair protein RecF n=1 Tax=Sedimentibacter hydroxybenzoicus DSM 7310 TaxID=1123245 RepID=A0A974GXV2_SEDHY|nr:DNA replication/repair protein RecF [Sedimentibacter hydroxybenzoicus]NYB75445.1 DNA replication/repair protein RecF [Sedimentibacter hydroxybenzoicus DSM 7310]